MRSIEQIIHDNGGDNTPALDTHNLTGRAFPEGVEPEWVPLDSAPDWYDEDGPHSYEHFLSNLDWASDTDESYDLGYLGDECG